MLKLLKLFVVGTTSVVLFYFLIVLIFGYEWSPVLEIFYFVLMYIVIANFILPYFEDKKLDGSDEN